MESSFRFQHYMYNTITYLNKLKFDLPICCISLDLKQEIQKFVA
jgi:hypothetical protein